MAYYKIRDWLKDIKPGKKLTEANFKKEYFGVSRETLQKMYTTMVLARRIELEEKNLLRRGICRFFIGCGGKELIDVVLAEFLNDDDPFVGYYRNKAFDMYRGVSIKQKIYEAVGDARSESTGGMLQPSHSRVRPAFPASSVASSGAVSSIHCRASISAPTSC